MAAYFQEMTHRNLANQIVIICSENILFRRNTRSFILLVGFQATDELITLVVRIGDSQLNINLERSVLTGKSQLIASYS